MIDVHVINTALARLGIGAAAVVLIAAAVLALAAFARRGRAERRIAQASAAEHAAVSNQESGVREPALR